MSEYLPCILCVKDLSICCVEEHLRVEFSPFGTISKVEIKKGTETFKSLGYGFVSFTNHRDAEHAMVSLQGRMMFGRSMKISWGDREFIHRNPPSIIKEQHAEISFSFKSDQLDCMVYERTISQLFSLFGCEVVDAAFKVHSISKKFQVQNGSGFVHFELSPHGIKCAIDAVCALQNSVVNERIIIDCDLSNSLRELLGIELSPTRTRSNSYTHKSRTPPKLLASQKMSARHVASQDGDGTVGNTIPHSMSMDSFATDSSTSDTAPTRASSPLTVSLRDTVTSLLNSKSSSAYSRVFQPRIPELDKSEARRFTTQSELHYLTMVHFEHLTGPSTPPHHIREKYSAKREPQEGLYGADHPTTRYSPGLPPPFPAWSPYQQHNQQQLLQLQQQQAVVDWHNAQNGQYPGPQTVTYAPQQVSGMVQHPQYLPQHYQMQTFQPLHPVAISTPDPSYWHPAGIVHHQTAHLHHQIAAAHPVMQQMASSTMDGSQTSAAVAAQGGHPGQHSVMWLGPPPMPPTYSVIHSAPYMPYPQLPPQQHGGGYFNGYVQQYGTPMVSFPQTPQPSTGYNPSHPSGRRDRGYNSNSRPYSSDSGVAAAGLQAPTNSPLLETDECRERDDYSRTMSDLSTDAPHTGCSGPESQVDRALTPSVTPVISPQGPLAQEQQHEQPAVFSATAALPTIVEESYTYAVGGSRRPSLSSDSGLSVDRIATAMKGEVKSAECLATMDPTLNATAATTSIVDTTSASMTAKVDTSSVVGGGNSSVNGDEVTMTDSSALSSAELSSALLHLQLFNASNLSTN